MTKRDDEDQKILKDGEKMRVPMTMADSLQQAVFAHFDCLRDTPTMVSVVDANGYPAGHRPGYCFPVVSDDAQTVAYEDYRRQLSDAWRQPG